MQWDMLDAKWNEGLRHLEAYRDERGDCNVPSSHTAADGFNLGRWVNTQRRKKQGKMGGHTTQQTAQLEALGMKWGVNDAKWDKGFRHLEAYRDGHGDCYVPYSHAAADGFNLAHWVSTQRRRHQGKIAGHTTQQTARLEALGMLWDANDA